MQVLVVHWWLCGRGQICNQEVAGSNLGRGYFAPRSTQPSNPPGSVNEYQLWLGRQRQLWLIPLADEKQGVQVKLCYPLTMGAIPERLSDVSCIGTIQIDDLNLLPLLFCN